MTDSSFIAQLQEDVRDCLIGLAPLLERADALELHAVAGGAGGAAALVGLQGDVRSVERLELRMPIIAPMSAGKSTIVNAMAGMKILPSRSAASTTVPTRIVLDDEIAEPTLEVSAVDAARFDQLALDVRPLLDAPTCEKIHGLYPDVRETLRSVLAGAVEPCPERCVGVTEIHRVLLRLNDLVRLAAVADEDPSLVSSLSDVPTLRTPAGFAPAAHTGPGLGTLVIVDTPGPDDTYLSELLSNVVAAQLSRAHAVVLVLDYTGLKNQAADDMLRLLRPALQQIGTARLFAIVNKVDQRLDPEDLDVDGVRHAVAYHLGFSEAEARERVFETKARVGLLGAMVLGRLAATGGQLDPRHEDAVKRMLEARAPFDWQRELAAATPETLREQALQMWDASGLSLVLELLVTRLRARAAPDALDAALRRAEATVGQVASASENRAAAMQANEQELVGRMRELTASLGELDRLAQLAPSVEDICGLVVKQVADLLAQTRSNGFSRIHDIRGARHFDTAKEAKKYIKKKRNKAVDELESMIYSTRGEIERRLTLLRAELIAQSAQQIEPVLQRAGQAVDLSPSPAARLAVDGPSSVDGGSARPKAKTSSEFRGHASVEESILDKLGRVVTGAAPPTGTPIYDETTTYKAGLGATRRELNASWEQRMGELDAQVRNVVAPALAASVAGYFAEAARLVAAYRADLEAARRDLTAADGVRRARLADLARLRDDAQAAAGELADLRARAPVDA